MEIKDHYENVAKANDLNDLLDHIAWTDVIRPKLLTQRDLLTKHLVGAVLDPNTKNKEILAGQISGIDYVIDLFEGILSKGRKSNEVLKSINIHFE